MAETHMYTVNLRPAQKVSRRKRAGKAMRILREYVQRHAEVETVSLSNAVNEAVWQDGAQRPPRSVEIKVRTEDGTAHVGLADRELEIPDEEPASAEAGADAYDDAEIAEMTVDEVQELVEDNAITAERALDIEYAGKNRKTLIEWLESRVEEPETADEAEEELEAEVEEREAAPRAAEDQEDEETYDLPDAVVETLRDGTIAEGKEAAQDLNKSEFEKLLNFEEAHQDRKGMKKFLRSNMN